MKLGIISIFLFAMMSLFMGCTELDNKPSPVSSQLLVYDFGYSYDRHPNPDPRQAWSEVFSVEIEWETLDIRPYKIERCEANVGGGETCGAFRLISCNFNGVCEVWGQSPGQPLSSSTWNNLVPKSDQEIALWGNTNSIGYRLIPMDYTLPYTHDSVTNEVRFRIQVDGRSDFVNAPCSTFNIPATQFFLCP